MSENKTHCAIKIFDNVPEIWSVAIESPKINHLSSNSKADIGR